ncbi:MAG: hypothetical protein AVDCRST_MAG30-3374, partial [uncultured Solirubrobacteraceae bacterium]
APAAARGLRRAAQDAPARARRGRGARPDRAGRARPVRHAARRARARGRRGRGRPRAQGGHRGGRGRGRRVAAAPPAL